MTLIALYITTFVIFMGLDYFGLSYLIKPIFTRDIGPLLLDQFRIGPAIMFYSFYIGVLLWFVSWPAMQHEKSLLWVLGNAALIGAMCYGTYEFTSLAVMKDWTWAMTLTDFVWGTCLTAVAASGGVWIARMVT